MKLKTHTFGNTFSFVAQTESGLIYVKLKEEDGWYDVPKNVHPATNCFVTAEHCLDVLSIPIFLLGEDHVDNEIPEGVFLSVELHKNLLFTYRDFRFTGVMSVKQYSKHINDFYCYMTKMQLGVGYIQPTELQQLVIADNTKVNRQHWVSPSGQSFIYSYAANEKYIVFSKVNKNEPEVPSAYFMIHKDNAPIRIDKNLHPQLFAKLSPQIESVQILYSRAASNYPMAPNVVVTSFDVFGDVLTSCVIFDVVSDAKSSYSPFPPTLAEVLNQTL